MLCILINIAREMIKNDFGNFKIDIFGDYVELEYKNMINSLIKKYNLKEYIFLKGFKEIHKIPVENYNVYIHTSKKPEPFGRTIIECMSLNIPVCATAMGGVLDIINHKNNGILYDLSGRMIKHELDLTDGIYIKNGKKFYINR